jgi:hypothetical protein
MWKGALRLNVRYYFGICVEGLRKFMKTVRNDIVVLAEFQTGHLPYAYL